jgi:hypothetical protein
VLAIHERFDKSEVHTKGLKRTYGMIPQHHIHVLEDFDAFNFLQLRFGTPYFFLSITLFFLPFFLRYGGLQPEVPDPAAWIPQIPTRFRVERREEDSASVVERHAH